ncbi:MAG: hypothetical protein ABI662_13010, partial [Dermatophilaceae bacterium]
FISVKTVRNHLEHIYLKVGVSNRTGANVLHTEIAIDLGVVSPGVGIPRAEIPLSESRLSHEFALSSAGGVGVARREQSDSSRGQDLAKTERMEASAPPCSWLT